jgi:hypothetical protein
MILSCALLNAPIEIDAIFNYCYDDGDDDDDEFDNDDTDTDGDDDGDDYNVHIELMNRLDAEYEAYFRLLRRRRDDGDDDNFLELLRLIRFDDRIDAITANYFRYLLP